MNRIRTVSARFLGVFKCLIILLPAIAIVKWLCMNSEFIHSDIIFNMFLKPFQGAEGNIFLPDVAWTPLTQLIGLLSNLLALTPIIISLYALIRIFKHYQCGEIFNMANARYYRLIGWMFILDGLITKSISDGLLTVAVTLNNAPGHRYITLGFGFINLEAIFCGAVIIVVSWVMLEASKLHEEQQYTV